MTVRARSDRCSEPLGDSRLRAEPTVTDDGPDCSRLLGVIQVIITESVAPPTPEPRTPGPQPPGSRRSGPPMRQEEFRVPKLRFGIFMPPFNSPSTQNPTTSLQRNMETIQLIDRLGYDEAWIGEHHSAGTESSPTRSSSSPTSARSARHIKLGTGVVSLPYHNPLWVADRAMLARPPDPRAAHARRRPGLASHRRRDDRAGAAGLRRALEEDLEVPAAPAARRRRVIAQDRPVQLSRPATQLGPVPTRLRHRGRGHRLAYRSERLAGKNGSSLLSLGATTREGFDALALHWDVMEAEAAKSGRPTDRDRWRLVGPMHIAETQEQAIEDVRYGFDVFGRLHPEDARARRTFRAAGDTFEERVAWINETGLGVIGTPDMAIAPDPAADGPVRRRVRLLHDDAARMGQRRGHAAQLRAVRPPRHAGLPALAAPAARGPGVGA